MNLSFFPLLRPKPAHAEVAELRDRVIIAETQAVLLMNEVEHLRRPRRERRRDASDIRRAIAARAKAYSDRFENLKEDDLRAFIAAAKNGGRG